MKIKFKITRCDPFSLEKCEPYWQAYSVDVEEGMTVLEALLKISEEDDPTLSFRRSCRSAICGSCAVTVNGFPKLACSTQILPLYKKEGEMTVGPISNHRVIKDLIVDFTPFWDKMAKVLPYLTPTHEPDKGWVIKKEDANIIDRAQKCIMCGCCNAACNSLEIDPNFIAPAACAKAWRFVGDVREGNRKKRLERLSEEHGIWDCVRCVNCTQYCPKDVSPLEAIERLRSKAILGENITDNPGARHVVSLVDSVKRVGRLDEAAMTFRTLGFLRSLGMIPFGIKMEIHGKMPHPLIFPAIEKIKEVKEIYDAFEKKKKE